MKILTLFLVNVILTLSSNAASPDTHPRAQELDWNSKDIQVTTVGDDVRIVLHTGGTAGRRLIKVDVQSFGDDPFITLTYQIIQNIEESYKNEENFDVTWTIPKAEFTKLRAERKFYILRLDEVMLDSDEVKEIQKTWKTH